MAKTIGMLCTLALALALTCPPCFALICDGGVVSEGDTQMDVLKRCGSPTYQTQPDELYTKHPGAIRQSTVVDWVFNFGPRRFMYTITFVGGRVAEIEAGDYGF